MSNVQKFLSGEKDVGGIPVARALPQAKKRTIGAWCFLDHIGPSDFGEGEKGLQVGSHPHINLQTFTWMIDGELLHKDSLGHERVIRRNEVNLMTAGSGIAHTEQTPEGCKRAHAVQLWIVLPKDQVIAPSFHFYEQLPMWSDAHADYILTTGTFGSHTAPTLQYSPIVGVDIRFQAATDVRLPTNPAFEYGLLVISGSLKIGGETFAENELAYVAAGSDTLPIEVGSQTHIMLIGGTPLDFEPIIWWNFVAPERTDINRAAEEWNQHSKRFGEVNSELKRLLAPTPPWAAQ